MENNLRKIRIQNLAARIIIGNSECIHSRSVGIVWSLNLQTIEEMGVKL